jgi:hypothetical protein
VAEVVVEAMLLLVLVVLALVVQEVALMELLVALEQ